MTVCNRCKYCNETYKGIRGLHIHQHYCLTKGFTEMETIVVGGETYQNLMENTSFIPNASYLFTFFKFIKQGEIGMLYDKRYILDNP